MNAGDRSAPDAARAWSDPLLDGYVAFDWDAMDEWFAEDDRLFRHPRDPYHRIDVHRSTAHLCISRDGVLLAETRRARVLFETGHPARYYLPAEDVRMDLLVPSEKMTRCAYKGLASYWSVRLGDGLLADLAWTYPEPLLDAVPVGGLLCFFQEHVDLERDGERQARPQTQWSSRRR